MYDWEKVANKYDITAYGVYNLRLINAMPKEEQKENYTKIVNCTQIIREKAEKVIPLMLQNKVTDYDIIRLLESFEKVEKMAHDDGVDDAING